MRTDRNGAAPATLQVEDMLSGILGRANGHANGHAKGHANGHVNGLTNGHANGHANGHSDGLVLASLATAAAAESAALLGTLTETWDEAPAPVASPAPSAPARNGSSSGTVSADWVAAIQPRTGGLYARGGKRLLDLLGATAGILFLGPVMAVFAMLIKATSRGPVLYRSTRLGHGGRPFTFYKFRSMYVGADRDRDQLLHLNECDGPVFKISRDPRTTAIGRFMRSTSIDELPQFFNVLRGEMSLVGPRPPLPEEESKYEAWQRRRLEVKPGITCLWQISGRSRLGFDEWMRLDLEYIKRQSFATDARILWRTIPAVLSRDGAY